MFKYFSSNCNTSIDYHSKCIYSVIEPIKWRYIEVTACDNIWWNVKYLKFNDNIADKNLIKLKNMKVYP